MKIKFLRIAESLIIRLRLIQLTIFLKMPSAAARLALLVSRSFDTGSENNVLCLGRPIFDEDIEELAKYGSTLNYLIIPKFVFIIIYF